MTSDLNALREGLTEAFWRRGLISREYAERLANDCIAGLLAALIAKAESADRLTVDLAAARTEIEGLRAQDRRRVLAADLVIALCDSVLGNAYLGKEAEEELAADLKSALRSTAPAGAPAEQREGAR